MHHRRSYRSPFPQILENFKKIFFICIHRNKSSFAIFSKKITEILQKYPMCTDKDCVTSNFCESCIYAMKKENFNKHFPTLDPPYELSISEDVIIYQYLYRDLLNKYISKHLYEKEYDDFIGKVEVIGFCNLCSGREKSLDADDTPIANIIFKKYGKKQLTKMLGTKIMDDGVLSVACLYNIKCVKKFVDDGIPGEWFDESIINEVQRIRQYK